MAPNVVGGDIDQVPLAKEKERLEIFHDGYFYDVTNFVDRHPGGNVIKFYTESGEDATQAIEQFHYRNRKRVDAIMKSFKRRPAPAHERGLEAKELTRHQAISADFKKLFEELQAEGYFEPSIRHTILRLVESVGTLLLAYGVVNMYVNSAFPKKFAASIFLGFAYSRYGWLLHEGGHNSLTGNPKIDKFIGQLGSCFVLGGSSLWWNSQHNRHHAMPQRLNHDVDLATLPYVAFHKKTVTDPKQINNFFVRYQAVFYWTLDLFVVVIAWKFVLHPRYQIHKKAYFEMLLNILSYYIMFHYGLIWFFTTSYFFTFFLGINFALSHSHLDVADKPTHWVEYSLTHTANITSSPLVDYWMGYLNYQIEHHLFPSMPQFRQKEIGPRVKALAEKHGLPYKIYNYPEACRLAMSNLNEVGRELTSGNFSAKQEVI